MDELLPVEATQVRDSVNRFMEAEVNPFMDAIELGVNFRVSLSKKPAQLGSTVVYFQNRLGVLTSGTWQPALLAKS
jgi:hypothetical protein